MKHKYCGGEIYLEYTGKSAIGMYLDHEGEPTVLAYDEPFDLVHNVRYQCQECEEVWGSKSKMLKDNV